jgi:hypothetical protein
MIRRKIQGQQSAASGVGRAEFGSRFGLKRAEGGGGARRDAPDHAEQWNAGRDGNTGRGTVAEQQPQDFDAVFLDEAESSRSGTSSHDDFCRLLSQAIAGLDRDSYATRGAVYDRECRLLMRRLYSANPPLDDAQIDAELRVFRRAVRTVEFGLDEQDVALVPGDAALSDPGDESYGRAGTSPRDFDNPQDEREGFQPAPEVVSPVAAPRVGRNLPEARPSGELQRRALRGPPPWSQRQPAQAVPSAQIESALEAALKVDPTEASPDGQFDQPDVDVSGLGVVKRKSVSRRVLSRALLAVALLTVGAAGYDLLTGELDLPLLNRIAGDSFVPAFSRNAVPQQVLLFDGSRPDLDGTKVEGKVYWQLRADNSGADSAPAIQLDLDVPGRRLAATMVMRREPAGSSMSHIVEIRFLGEDRKPDPDISNVAGIVMTSADMTRPNSLTGHVVSVTPGLFMFGLSGLPNDRELNLRRLIEWPWIGIPITYRNGSSGVLTFEKGDAGNKVIKEALDRWASGS